VRRYVVTARYNIDFHIPIKGLEKQRTYPVEVNEALKVRELLELLTERFSSVRLLMSYGGGKRPPVAVLVGGRSLDMDDVIPDGAEVKIIGAVAGG
jgi:molybdopterin converting factor small subunit